MINIFVVEDDNKLKDLYCRILKKFDYNILDTANDGEEAIEKYLNFKIKPDLVLIDHRMPNKTGIETINELRKIDEKVKFILATADQTLKDKVHELNIETILFKPFSANILIKEIKNLLS